MLALGLGSNLGNSERVVQWALQQLESCLGPLRRAPLYRTAPVSPIPQPDYLNTAVMLPQRQVEGRGLHPAQILVLAKDLEHEAGRRRGPRDGPRPLDIDLLFYGGLRLQSADLCLPHPRLSQRRFVLQPLVDLAPDLRIPGCDRTVAELLRALGDEQRVSRW